MSRPSSDENCTPSVLLAPEQAHFFASHLAEVPERINTRPDPDQLTQLEHGAIWREIGSMIVSMILSAHSIVRGQDTMRIRLIMA
jgi:hypothetical protein